MNMGRGNVVWRKSAPDFKEGGELIRM